MQRIGWRLCVIFCVVGFVVLLPSAWAQQDQSKAQAELSQRQYQDMQRFLQRKRQCQRGCGDCWYGLFPGMVNYCLGLRDWKKGSYEDGMELLKLAAGWGNKSAQYTLGLIYFKGDHVESDRARSLAWLMLANERHNDPQIAMVERSILQLTTVGEKRQAQQLFRQLRKRYGDRVAGVRAWHRLRRALRGASSLPKNVCFTESGDRVPWEHGILDDSHVLCMPSGPLGTSVAKIATKYFKGLEATVTVGPLQSVPAPASTSIR